MKFKEFEKHITIILAARERDRALTDLLKVEGIVCLSDDLINSLVSILEEVFHDHSEWISYWLWELEGGENYVEGTVTMNKKIVPLKTIRDLYQILTIED